MGLLLGQGPIAQLAEHRADNAGVTGAIPVRPTSFLGAVGPVAQLVERLICIQEVSGSTPLRSIKIQKIFL